MLEEKLRQLAASSYWQQIYHASKERNIRLFDNDTNLSGLQIVFLYWLEIYNFLYDLQSQKEYTFLDDKYIKDTIRVDAFLYYRKREMELKLAKSKLDANQSKQKFKKEGKLTTFNVDFA